MRNTRRTEIVESRQQRVISIERLGIFLEMKTPATKQKLKIYLKAVTRSQVTYDAEETCFTINDVDKLRVFERERDSRISKITR